MEIVLVFEWKKRISRKKRTDREGERQGGADVG